MIFPIRNKGSERSQRKGVQPKMRERKLRGGGTWQWLLKQKRVKQRMAVI